MKIEIEINDEVLKKAIIEKIANEVFYTVWNRVDAKGLSYEQAEVALKKQREQILKLVDWKNAGAQLSENVVQKFFLNLLEKR